MRPIQPRRYGTTSTNLILAFLFAVCALVISTFDTWVDDWTIQPGKPAPVTVRLPSNYFRITLLRSEVHYLSTTSSACPNLVPKDKVLRPGNECTGLAMAYESKRRAFSLLHHLGLFSFFLVIGLTMGRFMRHGTMGRARLLRAQVTVFALLTLLLALCKALLLFTALPALVLPVALLPLIAGQFFRRQVAFAIVLCTALSTAALGSFSIELFLVFTVAGMAAVLAAGGRYHRSLRMLRAGMLSGWSALAFSVVSTLIFSGTFNIYDDPAEHIDPRYSLWIAGLVGGISAGILASVLAPLVGRLVGEVSRSRLLDLQDLNQRLLKRIQELAPGTWEHSRAMANLAEAAVNAIGGNATLVRVGAYYHDVGKSNLPEYFIENQGGRENAHDALAPIESASCIFRHVTEGTKLLRQEGVPEDVIEFCYSHHGTSLLEFFWHKVMADGNPDNYSEKDFTYPGHKPTTRETGILMLVDAIEAGARTVDKPDKDAFTGLVQAIVFSKLSQGQLDESGLSLSDLRTVVNTLVDTLVNMYHVRIKYPWQTGDTGTVTRSSSAPPPPPEDSESSEQGKDSESPSEDDTRSSAQEEAPSDDPDANDANALTLVQPPKGDVDNNDADDKKRSEVMPVQAIDPAIIDDKNTPPQTSKTEDEDNSSSPRSSWRMK